MGLRICATFPSTPTAAEEESDERNDDGEEDAKDCCGDKSYVLQQEILPVFF